MATVTLIGTGTRTFSDAFVTATIAGLGAPLTSGHIVAVAGFNDNETLDAADITDTDGLAWQIDDQSIQASVTVYVFSAEITSGSVDNGHTFTVDANGVASNRKGLFVYHIDGLASTLWMDENGRAFDVGGANSTPSATLDATTDEDDTLVFGAGFAATNGSLGWTPGGTDGDVLDVGTNRSVFTSWHEESSAGTHSEDGTMDSAGSWVFAVIAYILDTGDPPASGGIAWLRA